MGNKFKWPFGIATATAEGNRVGFNDHFIEKYFSLTVSALSSSSAHSATFRPPF
jgi:hypothetical protein